MWIQNALIGLADTLGIDYITDEGSENSWTWRKWKSGVVEAWGKETISIANTTPSAAYGGYRSGNITVSIPSGIFSTKPTHLFIQKNGDGALHSVSQVIDSTTSIHFLTGAGESATRSDTWVLYVRYDPAS